MTMLFVTGATGFVGRHFVDAALAAGCEVRRLARRTPAERQWRARVDIRVGQLGEGPIPRAWLQGCAAVAHFAALVRGARAAMWRVNVDGTRALCAAAADAGASRLQFMSSLQASPTFRTEYGESKLEAERAVTNSDLEWTTFRPTQIYGDGDRMGLTAVARMAGRAPVLPLPGGGRALVQPVYVRDVVGAMLFALDRAQTVGRCYEIAGPRALPLAEFVGVAAALQRRATRVVNMPMWAIRATAPLARALRPEWLARDVIRTMDADKTASIDAAQRDLAYAPMDVTDGLRITLGIAGACL